MQVATLGQENSQILINLILDLFKCVSLCQCFLKEHHYIVVIREVVAISDFRESQTTVLDVFLGLCWYFFVCVCLFARRTLEPYRSILSGKISSDI